MKTSRTIAVAFVVCLVVGVAALVLLHFRAKARTARYRERLAGEGVKIKPSDLAPLPPTNYAGPRLLGIGKSIPRLPYTLPLLKTVQPGAILVCWKEESLLVRSIQGSDDSRITNAWSMLDSHVRSCDEALTAIANIVTNSPLYFPLDYELGCGLQLPHLNGLNQAADQLSAATIFYLHERQPQNAFPALMALVAIPRGFANEPLMISQRIRFRIASVAFQTTWQALQYTNWSNDQLTTLQTEWERMAILSTSEASLNMELALAPLLFNEFRDNPRSFGVNIGSSSSDIHEITTTFSTAPADTMRKLVARFPMRWCWKLFWSYDDEIALCELYRSYAQRIKVAQENGKFGSLVSSIDEDYGFSDLQWARGLTPSIEPMLQSYVTRGALSQTVQTMTVTAIALKRFHLKHGRYPGHLEELVPTYLTAVPMDHLAGDPLRYHRRDDGQFLLYSVGINLNDDGGNATAPEKKLRSIVGFLDQQFIDGLDLVWPRPATLEEVRASQENEARVIAP